MGAGADPENGNMGEVGAVQQATVNGGLRRAAQGGRGGKQIGHPRNRVKDRRGGLATPHQIDTRRIRRTGLSGLLNRALDRLNPRVDGSASGGSGRDDAPAGIPGP